MIKFSNDTTPQLACNTHVCQFMLLQSGHDVVGDAGRPTAMAGSERDAGVTCQLAHPVNRSLRFVVNFICTLNSVTQCIKLVTSASAGMRELVKTAVSPTDDGSFSSLFAGTPPTDLPSPLGFCRRRSWGKIIHSLLYILRNFEQ
jgi:hypothetical protein